MSDALLVAIASVLTVVATVSGTLWINRRSGPSAAAAMTAAGVGLIERLESRLRDVENAHNVLEQAHEDLKRAHDTLEAELRDRDRQLRIYEALHGPLDLDAIEWVYRTRDDGTTPG